MAAVDRCRLPLEGLGVTSTRSAAFLVVDVVGSTDLLHRLGDDVNDELRSRYKPLLRDAVERHGGEEIQDRGDGLMAAFPTSAAACVAAAIAMHQAVELHFRSEPLLGLQLRIGLAFGEAVPADGDWSGVPVVQSVRLEGQALPGTILASSLFPEIVGNRGGFEFRPVGARDLKGFPTPVPCVEVSWEPLEVLPQIPLPPELSEWNDLPLTGRAEEVDLLATAWKRSVEHAASHSVTLRGAPGIGKSRLAKRLAAVAHSEGAAVLYGRCPRQGSGGAGAWSDGIRWWVASVHHDTLLEVLGPLAAELAPVVPSLNARLGRLATPTAVLPVRDLATVIASAVYRIAQVGPLLFVIDDAHRADELSAAVVEDLGSRRNLQLMVLAVERAEPSTRSLPTNRTIDLPPLRPREVIELVGLIAEEKVSEADRTEEVASRVAQSSGGVPRDVIESTERLLDDEQDRRAGRTDRRYGRAGSPYRGLLPYEQSDSDLYFGRADEVASLLARLRSSRFVAVTGSSGTGKSSLVKAGVIPAMSGGSVGEGQSWLSLVVTPGPRPLFEVASGLASLDGQRVSELWASLIADATTTRRVVQRVVEEHGAERLLLVVDQFEELVTLCDDEEERRAFVEVMLEAATPSARLHVVCVIRSDFYGRCAELPGLRSLFETATFIVGSMNEADLREAITRPAEAVGLELDPGLVELMLRDVEEEPGALPLLSHALFETWKRRENGRLTVAAYRESGGVRAAIARTAESVFVERFDDDQQDVARQMFLRLTELGDGSDDTRRRVDLAELEGLDAPVADVRKVLAELTASRLVTVGDDTVQVAHEALIREWPRLRSWLDEDRDRLRAERHLKKAARDWTDGGRDPGDLYGAARLSAVEHALDGHDGELEAPEREFLNASRERRRREQRQQRADQRRLRRMLVAACVGVIVLMLATFVALRQRELANDRAALARARTEDADFERLVSQSKALRDTDRALALLLAVEATRQRPGPASHSALFGALQADPRFDGYLALPSEATSSATVGDDLLAIGGADGAVRFLDLSDGGEANPAVRLGDPPAAGVSVMLAADGEELVVAARNDTDRVWTIDPTSGAAEGAPIEVGRRVLGVAVSERHGLLAAALEDSTVELFDLANGKSAGRLGTPNADPANASPTEPAILGGGDVEAMAFNPARAELALQRPGGGIELWDVGSQRLLAPSFAGLPPSSAAQAGSLQFSDDGTMLASYAFGAPQEQRLIDVERRTVLWAQRNHRVPVAFIGDRELITLTLPGELVRVDAASGDVVEQLADTQFTGGAVGVHIGGGGESISVVAQRRPVVGRWRLDGGGGILQSVGSESMTPLEVSPDGQRLLVYDGSLETRAGELVLVDVESSEVVSDDLPMLSAVFAGIGTRLLGVFEDGSIGVYDVERNQKVSTLDFDTTSFSVAAVSPDGEVLVGRSDGTLEFYRLDGSTSRPATRVPTQIIGLGFDEEGRRFKVIEYGALSVYDTADGDTVGPRIDGVQSADFIPGSEHLIVGLAGRGVYELNPVTGELGPLITSGIGTELLSVDVSGDGRMLRVTQGGTQTQLYDLDTLTPLGTAFEEPQSLEPRFGHGGGSLALGSDRGLQLWNLEPEQWVRTACGLVGRDLSEDERRRHLGTDGGPAVCDPLQ